MAVSRRGDEGPDRGQRLLAYREHRNKKSHRSRVTLSIMIAQQDSLSWKTQEKERVGTQQLGSSFG